MAFEYDGEFPVDIHVLTRAFEATAIESRDGGGGKKFQYIAAETCIRRLNEATGNRWSFGLAPGSFIQFLDGGNDRNGNPENVVMAICELTIPGLGTRQGIGVQRVKMPVQNGEDMLKGVLSDALKKCATLFGVALELYGPELDIPAENAPRAIKPPAKPAPPPPRNAPLSAPRTKATVLPNGREQAAAKLIADAAAKGVTLDADDTPGMWADDIDAALDAAGSAHRVPRDPEGNPLVGALSKALLALPRREVDEETGEVRDEDGILANVGQGIVSGTGR